MPKGEDWTEAEWFNYLYNAMTEEPVEGYVDYDLSDQSLGRQQYTGYYDRPLPREAQKQRSDYAHRLKMQQKLAEELRNEGVGGYLNQLEQQR
jgi:hypothetical protein